jgi:hypothetical protein
VYSCLRTIVDPNLSAGGGGGLEKMIPFVCVFLKLELLGELEFHLNHVYIV